MSETTTSGAARATSARMIALVGPFQSGKTSLFSNLLSRCGAGAARQARAPAMSVDCDVGAVDYLGDRYCFVDCPGSVEFAGGRRRALAVADAAVVVADPDPRKLPALQLVLRAVEDAGVPHFLFLNKIDAAAGNLRDTLEQLQTVSRRPLVLRQIPIWNNGVAIGFIDLALERAYVYREHAPSEIVAMPPDEAAPEKEARYTMLERLADYDDALLEELLFDMEPPRDQIFDDLSRELREGHVAPVLIGSAERGAGVTRLLKALRHEAPDIAATRARLGVGEDGPALAHVFRSIHAPHGGKLSLARVLRGAFTDGEAVVGSSGAADKISGVAAPLGAATMRRPRAEAGDTVAFGRLDHIGAGEALSEARGETPSAPAPIEWPAPVHGLALEAADRKDEMRLAAAIAELVDEDPTLVFVHDPALGEMRLLGQGEIHLRVALERLATRYGVRVATHRPAVGYKETIRHAASARGRHRKQSGGHGQFGDVLLEASPLARGEGFRFAERIHGGNVPKQYFAAIEAGCRDSLTHGPLGFPVVDVEAVLVDGSHHSVDSSDFAFRAAARLAMTEALSKGEPVLLEPMLAATIYVPDAAVSRAAGLVAARRGQISALGPRPDWNGWEKLETLIPEAEIGELIVELRSASAGAGFFEAAFDHLSEAPRRLGRGAAQAP